MYKIILLVFVMLTWPSLAFANDCPDFHVPDSHTTPSTFPMASGTTITIDASSCDPTHGVGGIEGVITQPAHGTAVTTDSFNATINYTNNGDGATTDSFTFGDTDSNVITVYVTIGAPTSPITVTPATLPTPYVGVTYTPVTLSASGGTAPYTYTLAGGSAFPPGMSFSGGSGTFSGTPTAWGAYNANITVQDSAGHSTTKGYDLSVPQPTTTGGALAQPFLNVPYSQTVQITGGTNPWHNFSVQAGGSLPPGLTLSSNGVISGTPTTSGSYTFTMQAFDSSSPTQYGWAQAYTMTVANATSPGAPTGATATAGNAQATVAFTAPASDGGAPITGYTVTSSPAGGVDSNAGSTALSHTVTGLTNGTAYTFTVTATNAAGTGPASAASNSVTPKPPVPTVANKAVTTPYNTAASIDLTGSITGAGITAVTIGTAPTHGTVSVSGETVTYTPASTFYGGTDSFTYTATNAGGTSAPATVTVTVGARPPLVFAPGAGSLPGAVAGAGYSTNITASNGTAPYGYAITAGSLPSGLTFNPSTGQISGTPTAVGNTSLTVTATDQIGFTGSASFTLAVSAPAITAPSLGASVVAGTSVTVDLTSGATGGPFTGAALVSLSPPSAGTAVITFGDTADASGTMMASLMASGHYRLKFTPSPTFSGTAVATYTLSDAYATSAPATVTFTVSALPDPTKDADVAGVVNAETEATKRFAQMEIDNFNSHLEQLHHGGCLTNSWGINLSDSRQNTQDQRARDDADQLLGNPEKATAQGGLSDSGIGERERKARHRKKPDDGKNACSPYADGSLAFWTAGSVNFGSTDFDTNSRNFNYTTFGVSAGMDYKFSDRFVAGVGFGIGSDQSFISDDGTRTNGLAYSAAVYGSFHPSNGVFVDGVAGYGWLHFNSRRFDSPSGDILTGSRDGRQVFGSLTAGYQTTLGGFFISPYARLDVSHSNLDAFSEDGADWSAIRYGSQSIDTLTGILGLRLAYQIPTDWGVVVPKLRLEYSHDFASGSSLALSYANITGSPSYLLKAAGTARDYATITLGTDIQVGTGWTFGADYGFTVDGEDGVGPQQIGVQLGGKF